MKIQKPKIRFLEEGVFGKDAPSYREFTSGNDEPFEIRNTEIDVLILIS